MARWSKGNQEQLILTVEEVITKKTQTNEIILVYTSVQDPFILSHSSL